MTDKTAKTLTSSGYYVSQEAPIQTDNPVATPKSTPPDILRCAYMELVVTDLAASRQFYVDILGLYVTEEDDEAIYLRSTEEFIHHNLVLRKGPVAAVAAFSYRVRSAEDLDRAVAFYTELGCDVRREENGFVKGIGDSVRVVDPRYLRPTEVDLLLGDPTKAKQKLGWKPKVTMQQLAKMMIESDLELARKEAYLAKRK